jgi:hypothetical protein
VRKFRFFIDRGIKITPWGDYKFRKKEKVDIISYEIDGEENIP